MYPKLEAILENLSYEPHFLPDQLQKTHFSTDF